MKPYTDSKRLQEFSAALFVQKIWSTFENLSKDVEKVDFAGGAEIQLALNRKSSFLRFASLYQPHYYSIPQ